MTLPVIARLLLVLGRSVGFAGAVLSVTFTAVGVVQALSFALRYDGWGELISLYLLTVVLQLFVGVWVGWGVFKRDARPLFLALLAAFGGTFVVGFGWYLLLAGEGGELVSVGNLLYLAAALVVGCALLVLAAGARYGNDSP